MHSTVFCTLLHCICITSDHKFTLQVTATFMHNCEINYSGVLLCIIDKCMSATIEYQTQEKHGHVELWDQRKSASVEIAAFTRSIL